MNKHISLAMIAGNEEANVVPFLDGAREVFDELCLVRAIGDLEPDKTVKLARAWCMDNRKAFVTDDYRNTIRGEGIDDFGAARNLSFKLASHAWILWMDWDDRITPETASRIREAAQISQASAILFSYRNEDGGGSLLRERLLKNGAGGWSGIVHETYRVIYGTTEVRSDIVITHLSHGGKDKASAERNRRLLWRATADAGRHYWYLHADLKLAGEVEEAKKAALAAWQILAANKLEERYVLAINLSELDPDNAGKWLLAALSLQPHRRDAAAHLCQLALKEGRLSDATSWFRMMDSLPEPAPLPWTHQALWHGWARNFLRVRILWKIGRQEDGDREHENYMKDLVYRREVQALGHE